MVGVVFSGGKPIVYISPFILAKQIIENCKLLYGSLSRSHDRSDNLLYGIFQLRWRFSSLYLQSSQAAIRKLQLHGYIPDHGRQILHPCRGILEDLHADHLSHPLRYILFSCYTL